MNFFEFFNNFIFTSLYFRICTLLWIAFALLSFIVCVIEKIVWRIKRRKYNEEMLRFAKSIGGIPTLSMYFTMRLFEEWDKHFKNDFLTNFPLVSNHPFEQHQFSEEELIALKNLRRVCRHQSACDAERAEFRLEEFEDKHGEI